MARKPEQRFATGIDPRELRQARATLASLSPDEQERIRGASGLALYLTFRGFRPDQVFRRIKQAYPGARAALQHLARLP